MEIINQLKKHGLNEIESKVYIAALELHEAPASRIAKKIGLPRLKCYNTIQSLLKKQFI